MCNSKSNKLFLPNLFLIMVFYHSNSNPSEDRNWYQGWGTDVAYLTMMFLGGLWKDFGTLGRRVIECCELSELFCGSLEDKTVGDNADEGGLACVV